ncbi:MAG: hypothetical protein HZA46_23830 [Planctomycetales bacterium]|nr:hypothetical protein [Planctomycetales bacterium]
MSPRRGSKIPIAEQSTGSLLFGLLFLSVFFSVFMSYQLTWLFGGLAQFLSVEHLRDITVSEVVAISVTTIALPLFYLLPAWQVIRIARELARRSRMSKRTSGKLSKI